MKKILKTITNQKQLVKALLRADDALMNAQSDLVDRICFDPEVRKNAKLALSLIVQQAELTERMRVVEIAQSIAGMGSFDAGPQDIVVLSLTKLLQALPANQ